MSRPRMPAPGARERGAGLVEWMVGVVVAIVTVLLVYRVFIVTESLRRNAESDGDAQQTALFVLSRLSFDVANAGAGIVPAAQDLATCPVTADLSALLRPISVLVTDSGAPDIPDSVVVRYAVGTGRATPVPFAAAAPSGAPFSVRSPLGFLAGDLVIAFDRRGACVRTTLTSVGVPAAGVVALAHDIVANDLPASAMLVDLGPAPKVVTTRYDVAGGVLRTTDVLGGDAPNPLASNIVNLKLQYGVDTDGDGALDTWVPAQESSLAGNWTSAAVLQASATTLARIKALRIGLVVRGEQFDRAATRGFDWVLFDCAATDKNACPGRLAGSIAPSVRGGYHYRVYETVVPLRNQLWSRG